MTTPEERRTVGGALRRLRTAAGLDSIQLGARSKVSASHIRSVENGYKTLTKAFAKALDDALDAGGVLTDLATTGDPMRRRILLHSIALVTSAPVVTIDAAAPSLGTPDIEVLATMTVSLRGLDNRLGGGAVRDMTARYLTSEARPLLAARMSDRVASRLLSSLAELAQLAGWTCYDSGLHGAAQRHLHQAHTWAAAAKDLPLAAELLAALAHQAAFLGKGTEAVHLAEEALRTAEAAAVPALAAEAAALAAHGYAVNGDSIRCARALLAAEHHLDRADRTGDPTWIGYMGPAYLAALRGHALLALGDPAAVGSAEASLDMDDAYVRGKAFNLALLASSLTRAGRPEEAAAKGRAALTLASDLRSARAEEYLRRVAVGLTAYRDVPAAAELIADISQRLTPQAI
ncbi:helix-turn-helix transcriptional regulator [Phytomonospora sp. NPDC050363]|uniref:helix-turn-helix domain-containing protein n=1 Tax=Phytomonospora sp. NPDC050363 TaxID=3155642 RepID=UPI0033C8BD89